MTYGRGKVWIWLLRGLKAPPEEVASHEYYLFSAHGFEHL